MTFQSGDVVRVTMDDPGHHTRAPRYVRGRRGRIVEYQGDYALPDRVVVSRGAEQSRQPVYSVRFEGFELWGPGGSTSPVVVDLWEHYLRPEAP